MVTGGIGKLGKPDENAHLPPPVVGAKRFPDHAVERGCQVRPGTGRLTERQVVPTEIDEGADLHIGNAMGAPEVGTLVIELGSTGHRAQLTGEPPQVILHTAQKEHIVPLVCLGHDVVRDAERLGIVALTPAGETQKGETVQSMKAHMYVTGKRPDLLGTVDGSRKMPLPVGKRTEEPQGTGERVVVALSTADLERRGKVPLRCLHVPAIHRDRPQGGETL